ncbi:hypothetical protein CDD83_1038 [Cordyceps sp. RAO-2017]|nr:hypothetical protein CDD83_1038 [Cordyceps sp. RAO-2017]
MPLHKIFADQPRSAPFLQGCSRRVLLTNLPPDVSAAQVLRAVHGYGGVVSASIVPDLGAPATGSRAAMVEFVYAASAAQYVEYARHRPQSFRAADGSVHTAAVHLIPTLSYPHATGDHRLLQKNGTRALAFSNFPPAAIWYVLCLVGTRRVSNVQYNEQTGELTLEFESLFDANRALDTVERRLPLTLRRARCKTDSSQEWPSIVQDVHDHVPSTHIEQQWNRPPYNTHDYPRQEAPPPAAPERKPASPTPREKMAAQYDVSPSRLSSYIAERDAFEETEYRIIGSTIKLTRRGWGWSISAEDDMKLLMANALHEPDLADEWDRHFAAHDSVNLRTWERYGLLARHRRERAAEQGLEEWRVPQCGAACEWGCCSIKAAPVPRAVAQYLAA